MVYVLHGVEEFDTSGAKVLNIPDEAGFPVASGQSPVPYLSTVTPADPADLPLFKLVHLAELSGGNADPLLDYVGGRHLQINYTLTGGSPIDVEFYLVWDPEASPTQHEYAGG